MQTPTITRTKCAGANRPPVARDTIEREAIAAAQAGQSLCDACPYPFHTEAGQHFTAVWFVHSAQGTPVNTRPPAVPPEPSQRAMTGEHV